MKKTLWIAVLLVLSAAANSMAAEKPEKYSALKALKIAAQAVPQHIRAQVVRIDGEDGRLHPTTWKVVFLDPAATADMRVVTVSRGEVMTDEEPFAIFENINRSSCMNLRDIKLDSKDVINTVHRLCYDNKIPVYIVDARLEKLQKGNVTPLWTIVIKNARGNELGIIRVSAKTGKILETEDLVLTESSKLKAEKSFGQSTVDAFLGIGAEMEEFFTGSRTVDE